MKVSILSPVRNESLHIAEMIASVQAQTHKNWELLLVDDGSDDNTVKIICELASQDQRIRLVAQQAANGKVAAFNKAFGAASGQVIVLLAGDDRLPPGSLAHRVSVLGGSAPNSSRVLGLFKLVTFSDDTKFDGIVLPKGNSGSRSGGSLTMSIDLAKGAFPIPEHLAAEDIWLGEATRALTQATLTSNEVVLEYRIHPNNSNPRQQAFDEMSTSSHKRFRAYEALLSSEIPFGADHRARIAEMWRLEQYRVDGRWVRVILSGRLPVLDRLAIASHASPTLFWIRKAGYRWLSGLRGS